jgi:radical SAM superfamily enzyme YgiQ (UPF0313 family)
MRILLLNPINRTYVVMPSLGLGYLATIARERGHQVTVLNSARERMTFAGFADLVQREQYDVIGFQLFTYDLNPVKAHLAIIRQLSPGTVTIAGGPHPSGDPEGTLQYLEQLDFAFQGEAEIGFPLLLDGLSGGEDVLAQIPGLVWRDNGVPRVNQFTFVEDLDALPMPAWDLLIPEQYPEAPHGAFTRAFPTAPIIITRGCASGCTFCAGSRISGRRIRRRSLDGVMAELHHLADRGVKEFHIEDENFTDSPEFVVDFCQRLKGEGLGMSWSLPSGVRLDTLTREVVVAMAEAGCYSLAVGIEFGSDRMLRATGKGITTGVVRQRLQLFAGVPIKVTGFFLLGLPGESYKEMKETVRFSRELPLDRAQFNIFMPLPGSAEWEKLARAGRLGDVDWDRFFVHDVAYAAGDVSPARLRWLHRYGVARFYLRPRIVRGLLGEIRSPRHFFYLLKRFADALA